MSKSEKSKKLFWLLGIFAVLLILYVFLSGWNKSEERKKAAKEEADKIYVTDISDVAKISYDVGNGTVGFEKTENVWYFSDDKDFPLNQTYPEAQARLLGKLEASRKLETSSNPEEYGLEQPVYTITLTDEKGLETKLYVGDVTGEDYYVTVNDTGSVYTVGSTFVSELQTGREEMAQLDSWPAIGSGNIKKETITEGGKSITYDAEKEEDAEAISAVAGGLGVLTLTEVSDYSVETKDLAGFGLDETAKTTVQVDYTENEEDKTIMLYMGKEDGEGNRYIMVEESKIVYRATTEICNNILNQ